MKKFLYIFSLLTFAQILLLQNNAVADPVAETGSTVESYIATIALDEINPPEETINAAQSISETSTGTIIGSAAATLPTVNYQPKKIPTKRSPGKLSNSANAKPSRSIAAKIPGYGSSSVRGTTFPNTSAGNASRSPSLGNLGSMFSGGLGQMIGQILAIIGSIINGGGLNGGFNSGLNGGLNGGFLGIIGTILNLLTGGGVPQNHYGNTSSAYSGSSTPPTGNPPIMQRFTSNFNRCAPGCTYTHDGVWGDDAHKARESCHNSGSAIDIKSVTCNGSTFGPWSQAFDNFLSCMESTNDLHVIFGADDPKGHHNEHAHIALIECETGPRIGKVYG